MRRRLNETEAIIRADCQPQRSAKFLTAGGKFSPPKTKLLLSISLNYANVVVLPLADLVATELNSLGATQRGDKSSHVASALHRCDPVVPQGRGAGRRRSIGSGPPWSGRRSAARHSMTPRSTVDIRLFRWGVPVRVSIRNCGFCYSLVRKRKVGRKPSRNTSHDDGELK